MGRGLGARVSGGGAALLQALSRLRAANISGLVTNGFFGVIRSYVFIALFQNQPVAEGYDLGDALTYVWVTQALIMPLYIWGWQEIAVTIRSGAIASELSRPISYFGYWLSQDLGRAVYHILYRLLPTVAIGLVLFRVSLPDGPLAGSPSRSRC